ncbi:SRPBCC family protein [Amycolatopsis sp. YIM 10]|uniref:SRPBCC family protein n=1 Tax=Amycolatopsis sp. YIM 10 TaxID=2653857 RepID=UPI0012AA52D3|nr:SRPBCC family protein [Amycolatopsis sp. YIM 10]QFU91219.1 Polyketide cyclase / dehydrase and lipid transport [Amycolatopsis sp. YIM 10]
MNRQKGDTVARWYPLAESDDNTFRTARFLIRHVVDVPAPAERVWQVLSADDALVSWSKLITGAEWTSPRPFGVGTTRTVTVGGVAALRERFYRWDENERMTFSAEAASRPGFRRFAEDLTLIPDADRTRLCWTFAVDAAPWLVPVLSSSRFLLHRVTGGWADGLASRVGKEIRR